MPTHSSSSHSSSSRSSSSRSSSHSSSSHSSSSRSSSSFHSSSSHSSSYRSYGSGSNPSGPRSRYVKNGSMSGSVIPRSRSNQPTGYQAGFGPGGKPSTHNCKKHNYVYYPSDWVDRDTGKSYQKGYYDEKGCYYKQVVFKENGVYKDVIAVCDYCGTSVVRVMKDGTTLTCPQCGAPLRLDCALDEYTQDPEYTRLGHVPVRRSLGNWIVNHPILTVALAFILFVIISAISSNIRESREVIYVEEAPSYERSVAAAPAAKSNVDIFGETLYLVSAGDGCYEFAPEGSQDYDKKLTWDYIEEGYYDRESRCFLWYNTDMLPSIWQYYYEDIAPDFGSGWMEYEPDGWYIEESAGNWIPLPEKYDREGLWHLPIDPRDFS